LTGSPGLARGGVLRVLHGPLNVADQGPAVAEQQRLLGVRALAFEDSPHPFYPPCDVVARSRSPRKWERLWIHGHDFYELAKGFDVVHLHSSAFLPPIPVPLPRRVESAYLAAVRGGLRRLRAQGAVLAVTFHGDEVRPISEIRQQWLDADAVLSLPEYDERARSSRLRYSKAVARECDLVYVSTPDLLSWVPGAVLMPTVPSRPSASAGLSTWPRRQRGPGSALRVVHAPSNPVVKGSALIRAAVASLSESGVPLELEILEGRRVNEVVSALHHADVLVDQVNVGWYGVLAVEAQSMGVPTLARLSGRNIGLFEQAMGARMGPGAPWSFQDATGLSQLLREIAALAAAGDLGRVSADGLAFVRKFHDGASIARRILSDYEGVRRARFPCAAEANG
jgi:hypothetical protein